MFKLHAVIESDELLVIRPDVDLVDLTFHTISFGCGNEAGRTDNDLILLTVPPLLAAGSSIVLF